jgi:hypothetical protein
MDLHENQTSGKPPFHTKICLIHIQRAPCDFGVTFVTFLLFTLLHFMEDNTKNSVH